MSGFRRLLIEVMGVLLVTALPALASVPYVAVSPDQPTVDDIVSYEWDMYLGCGGYPTIQTTNGVEGNTFWVTVFSNLGSSFCLPIDVSTGGSETLGILPEGQYYIRAVHSDWWIYPMLPKGIDTTVFSFYVYDFSVCESGNVDGKEGIDLSDLIYLTNYLFSDGPEPPYMAQANVNGVDEIDLSDLISLVNYLFNGGPAPIPCE